MKMSTLAAALVLVATAASCSGKKSGGVGPDPSVYWKTSAPEDLPYSGKTPNLKTVSFRVNFATEGDERGHGTGSVTPFFSSDTVKHMKMDTVGTTAFEWEVEDRKLVVTLGDGGGTCTGEMAEDGGTFTIDVKGCEPLAAHTSAARATFAPTR